ncbi:ATP-binding domain-containing protein (plasmid) [Rhizobium gallicum]|uniref:ATP-binding domain-containing protein n=1 Tax=Rhizobium gallicum TaxID=56730 RepID=A0A1L5NUI0_9HYPH|nr:ATP-binding domain-containing protein [Rhizobium gallicum]
MNLSWKACARALCFSILAGLVKQVVELHQGPIEVRSARGSGSTFAVTLPMTRNSGSSARSDAA